MQLKFTARDLIGSVSHCPFKSSPRFSVSVFIMDVRLTSFNRNQQTESKHTLLDKLINLNLATLHPLIQFVRAAQ
jgi:hypothetical protein